jgi:hypothetical protein
MINAAIHYTYAEFFMKILLIIILTTISLNVFAMQELRWTSEHTYTEKGEYYDFKAEFWLLISSSSTPKEELKKVENQLKERLGDWQKKYLYLAVGYKEADSSLSSHGSKGIIIVAVKKNTRDYDLSKFINEKFNVNRAESEYAASPGQALKKALSAYNNRKRLVDLVGMPDNFNCICH